VLTALLGWGCAAESRPAVREAAPLAVATARVDVGELTSSFEAGGIVRARTTALIASQVMAPIDDVHVTAGDRVRRGAALVTLDARGVRATEAGAAATALAAVEAVRAAEADARAADADLVLARATHDRVAALYAKRSATQQELDEAGAALASAEARRAGAVARTAAANAARDAARASSQAAIVAATYAVLSAPFDGVITERRAEPGSMAAPGIPLLVLEDASAYRLEVQIDESRAGSIAVGHAPSVRINGAPDDTADTAPWMAGRVSEIARVDPASHSFIVKVDLPPSRAWRSGAFGRARFATGRRQALVVPSTALIRRGQLTFVYLVDAGERARLRAVSIGTVGASQTEVLAGLQRGDVVVNVPPVTLADGARVVGVAR
jgi:RND family efflux transporter MFP subunit